MADTFAIVMPWVEIYEGGYVDHPKDPGGATNRGVTQRTYTAYRIAAGKTPRDVRNLTDEEHHEIYREQYWDRLYCDRLPKGVDAVVFDFGVNSGTARAARTLQRIVGANVDGVVGLQTIAACHEYDRKHGVRQLIYAVCESRMKFLRRLKTFSVFGTGWTRRVVGKFEGAQDDDIGILDRAMKLAIFADGVPITKPAAAAEGKAREADMKTGGGIAEFFENLFRKRGTA